MAASSNSSNRASKSLRNAAKGHGFISVHVGPERRLFNVHKTLLMEHSGFFHNALQGPWKEAADGIVILEDVKPAIFDIFVGWLYTRKIPLMNDYDEDYDAENNESVLERQLDDGEFPDDNDSEDEDKPCEQKGECNDCSTCTEAYVNSLVKAYVLGDRFLAPIFKYAVLDRLIECTWRYQAPTWFCAISCAFNNLPEKDPMLSALVNIHCRYWTAEAGEALTKEKKQQAELVPTAFWPRTSNAYDNRVFEHPQVFWRRELNPCDYHRHHRHGPKEERECRTRWKARTKRTIRFGRRTVP